MNGAMLGRRSMDRGFEPGMGLVINIFFLSDVVDELKRVGFGKVEWKEKEGAMGERNIKN